jgi:hypothetical protein
MKGNPLYCEIPYMGRTSLIKGTFLIKGNPVSRETPDKGKPL